MQHVSHVAVTEKEKQKLPRFLFGDVLFPCVCQVKREEKKQETRKTKTPGGRETEIVLSFLQERYSRTSKTRQ